MTFPSFFLLTKKQAMRFQDMENTHGLYESCMDIGKISGRWIIYLFL